MKKSIIFLYGVLAYFVFLVAFLYAIGFVGNFIVPKSIDSGTEIPFIEAFLINTILLVFFAIQHTVMARPAFKKWWITIISPVIERSTFVLVASLLLLLLYWQWQPMPTIIWKIENETVSMFINLLFIFGWIVVLISTFMINHFELFGLKQIFENLRDEKLQPPKFKMNYLYKIVRHPIMLGFIIAFWATPLMSLGHLIFSLTTTIYIFIAVKYLEEKDLRNFFGKEYEDYQKKVPMLFPFIGKKS